MALTIAEHREVKALLVSLEAQKRGWQEAITEKQKELVYLHNKLVEIETRLAFYNKRFQSEVAAFEKAPL